MARTFGLAEHSASPWQRAGAGAGGAWHICAAHRGRKFADGRILRNDARGGADLERMYGLVSALCRTPAQTAGTLSGGEQQMVAMARALMSRPKLLMLDEPSMGLAPMMVQKIFETIRDISAQGVTILLVEQNAKLALEVGQRGYVLESGEITLHGEAAALLADPRVRHAYLGE